ncbi:DUF4012 domain-containing protein [Okibacterium fritillariae]|uniref:DUF4012 domain-containing protein n=1 Tax=Okibacterium fritillariae TaxID=123320 RepID=A0A1T5KBF4_9MICO|nr:DUF4012 domain-containing protein [Okibacterium fritillariae]SKC60785.1 Protein of unknown function [Okibacterium fritillariae]
MPDNENVFDPQAGGHRAGRRRTRRRGNRRGRVLIWSVTAAAVLLVGLTAWVGIRASLAKAELEAVIPAADSLRDAVLAQDSAAVSRSASKLNAHASAAHRLTSDPIWRAAEFVPVVGPNLTAGRQLASTMNDLAADAVRPVAQAVAGTSLADFKPSNGTINLDALTDAAPAVASANTALNRAKADVETIDTAPVLEPVRSAVLRLSKQLNQIAPGIQALSNALELAPKMLGSDGPRNYLMIFQNPAELRATGGIPGAMALIHTEDGVISLGQQASSADFPQYADPVIEVPQETRGLYGDIVGKYIQDVNLTPNFGLTGQLVQQMWEERYGLKVDGVISIDPVTLSYVLGATGPVSTPTGDVLTSDNVVRTLLNETYIKYSDSARQDLFFASAAKTVFDVVSSGVGDTPKLIDALSRGANERRILIWSSRDDERAIIQDTTFAGDLVGEHEGDPRVGLFLNDATGAKMDFYLGVSVSVGEMACRKDGKSYVAVEVTLTNNAPSNAGSVLPRYLTGGGVFGVAPGHIKTVVSAYGSSDMLNLGVERDGSKVSAHSASDEGRPVSQIDLELAPGESGTFRFGFLSSARESSPVPTQVTPTINMNETSELALTCESALW